MKGIEFLVFKRLGKTDLDVLENAPENEGHTVIALGRNRDWIDELAGGQLTWIPEGAVGSNSATIGIAAVPGNESSYPSQELKINEQGGERAGEIKLTQQREHPLKTWSDPVKASRPPIGEALIFLLRDEDGDVHARYVARVDDLPPELAARISGIPGSFGAINLSEEGRVVLEYPLLARIIDTLRNRYNVILYGPPGTGKTWLMTEVDRVFEEGFRPVIFDPEDLAQPFKATNVPINISDRANRVSEFVIFHQSTSYESFVAGLRPRIDEKGQLSYGVEKGPLILLAEYAMEDDAASLLLIDEINRGNTAEIFGELITVLEPDKRLDENGDVVPHRTIAARLPYAPEGSSVVEDGHLRMPLHFYTLGSMNSVDRTVAPLDSALRRRFHIIEVRPDLDLIRQRALLLMESLGPSDKAEWSHVSWVAHQLLERLNRLIAVLRGEDFQLGHAYIWSVIEDGDVSVQERRRRLFAAFGDRMLPQLRELFRDQPDELFEMLGGQDNQANGLFTFHRDPEVLSGLGIEPVGWLEFRTFPVEGDPDLSLEILRRIAKVEAGAGWETNGVDSQEEEVEGSPSEDSPLGASEPPEETSE